MNRLFLLRHAKAEAEAPGGGSDRDRPLADKGERAMRDIGAWAEKTGLAPDLVLCSPAARTRQTLALLLPQLGGRPQIKFEDGLYLAEADALLDRLRRVPAKCESVLLIGHNPGLHVLALALRLSAAGRDGKRLGQGLPTAGLAAFELDGPWATIDHGAARLTDFVTPKELRD
jgi:phosphohistidine phosphatase